MTWNEFKEYVDKELKGKNPEIDYIDTVNFPDITTTNVIVYHNSMVIH